MARANDCKGALNAAVKGAFSAEEVDAIAERLVAKRLKVKAEAPTLSDAEAIRKAAEELTVDEVKAGLIHTRQRQKAEIAKRGRTAAMGRMSGSSFDKLEALTIGSDKAGFGGHDSVDAMGVALSTELHGDIEQAVRAAGVYGRVVARRRDLDFEGKLAQDMAHLNGGKEGASGDADAAALARIYNDALEKARAMQNEAGAWIGKIEGYVVRQDHDALKVSGGFWNKASEEASFEKWRAFTEPLLGDKTFEDAGVALADRREFLRAGWTGIVAGEHEIVAGANDLESFLPKSGKARAVSAQRVWHFKTVADWMAYHNEYGRGSLHAAVSKQIDRAAKNTALMRRFGPNPDVAWANEVAAAKKAAKDAGKASELQRLGGRKLQGAYDEISGAASVPENLRLAMVMRLLRAHESVAKLGGQVLSAFSDIPNAVSHKMRSGVPFLRAYGEVFTGILRLKPREQKQALQMLDASARAFAGHMSSGVRVKDGALGFYTAMGRMSADLQGFTFFNEGNRSAAAVGFSRHLGHHANAPLEALPAELRAHMERYGIGAKDWDVIRQGVGDVGGERYVFADHITDKALALKARMMTQDLIDMSTSEARARERRALSGDGLLRPGSVLGEAVRAWSQFLSFSLTFVNRSLIPMAKDAFSGGPVAPLVNLILGTTLCGYLSVQAKELVKGHKPRPLTQKTFLAAMVQGGGLGIYGDFLFGEKSRMSGGLAETFGGPLVGDVAQLRALYLEMRGGGGHAGADAFRFGKSQIPLVNLWYTRAALDYLLFWRMQEAISPGWAEKYQRRVERENGAEFWLRPTDAVR